MIKLMGPGEYVAELPGESAPGHFGLAVKDYAHSTAPNRRYADLITQRLLKAAIAGQPSPYSKGELDALASRCTEEEDAVNKVERQVGKSAAALLLESRVGEKFEAIVTGASEKGTWVRLLTVPVEGRLSSGFEGWMSAIRFGSSWCPRTSSGDISTSSGSGKQGGRTRPGDPPGTGSWSADGFDLLLSPVEVPPRLGALGEHLVQRLDVLHAPVFQPLHQAVVSLGGDTRGCRPATWPGRRARRRTECRPPRPAPGSRGRRRR